jgi:hypothetical protein
MVDSSRGLTGVYVFSIVWLFSAATVAVQPEGVDSIGINLLRQQEPNLTGRDTTVALVCRSITYIDGRPQNDYKPDPAHNCFANTNFTLYNDTELPAGISEHSTAICSLLFGKDSDADEQSPTNFSYEGLVCDANAQVIEFWHFLKGQVFNNTRPEADIISASIGSVFEDWWTRGIEALAEQYGTVIVAGIGNGSDAYDLPLYPAAGSNVIAVGVVKTIPQDRAVQSGNRFSWAHPDKSSCGPTEDNRCKPDIVAPGDFLVAAASEPNQYRHSGSYSSFATPVVAGTAAILVQKAKTDVDLKDVLANNGGNCVIKAILMNTAAKLPYWHKGRLSRDDDHEVPLDFMHGAGVLDAFGAYNTLAASRHQPGEVPVEGWDLGTLQEEKTAENSYQFEISEPNNKMITITAVWNRHYHKQYPFNPIPEKDADIRLELWAYDKDGQQEDVLLDYSDSKTDNVEHIHCTADANYTEYEIVVSFADGTNPDAGLVEDYGLAWRATGTGQEHDATWYDLNGDGRLNKKDILVLLENASKSLTGSNDYLVGDINDDGRIDIKDITLFANQIR